MDFIASSGQTVFSFLLVLTVLIFVHELGHFLVARYVGVRVEVFSIGFGPEVFGFNDRFGTRWRFSAVPLGGYVKMFGEGDMVTGVDDTDERPMTDEEKKVSFHHKPLVARTAVVAAGPAANFLFSIVVFAFMSAALGIPKPYAVVGGVISGSAAEDAGFVVGDAITAINGEPVTWFEDLSRIVSASAGVRLDFTVERENRVLSIKAVPRSVSMNEFMENVGLDDIDEGATSEEKQRNKIARERVREHFAEKGINSRGLLGIKPHPEFAESIKSPVGESILLGFSRTYEMSIAILSGVGEMIMGEREAKELGGVISIAQYSGEAAQSGAITILAFMAALSINLGLINLFPVPMLDGGHLVYYFFEAIRGKPLSQRVQEIGFRIGLALVLALMVFATWNDIDRILERFGVS